MIISNLLKFKRCKVCRKKISLGIICGKCAEAVIISIYSGDINNEDMKKLIISLSNKPTWQSQKSGSQ